MIRTEWSGDFNDTESFLQKMMVLDPRQSAERFAKMGVEALKNATPVDSGLTASSWSYEIVSEGGGVVIYWTNNNVINGFNVAVGLRYGHGTGNGGYVRGNDFISPALEPVFERIVNAVWEEVKRS